jgi:UDP-N-acetylglucosamine/UDP-N-acetylgalactosamine diphosphorylase
MFTIPDDLRQRLQRHAQEHVLAHWDRLTAEQRQGLLRQVQALDLDLLSRLYARRGEKTGVPAPERIAPVPVIPHDSPDNAERRRQGEAALRNGEVVVLLVAGGQGSRLNFDHPKGQYLVGPVSRKPLFQVHAEKVLALSRRHNTALPFLVMTSEATHDETVAFFEEHRFFGLPRDLVFFFRQGMMPALDLATGRLLLEEPHRLFLSPDGHGGTLTALRSSGLLEQMKSRGIRHVFYFQVDNPLVKVADPIFLGHHLSARAEASSKVVAKAGPDEKMGVFALVDNNCTIIEYSDLPGNLARGTDEKGRLRLWAGSPAIHFFDLGFLERMTGSPEYLPFHLARKKVPCLGPDGRRIEPEVENALKFERFIFDVLPAARRWALVEALRAEEFSPLKNAEGADSPATVRRDLVHLAAGWLEKAGVRVPRRPDGAPAYDLEISPLFALDAEELAGKVGPDTTITGPRYFA